MAFATDWKSQNARLIDPLVICHKGAKKNKSNNQGNPSGAPPKATPPQEIAGLIKGLLTIGFP